MIALRIDRFWSDPETDISIAASSGSNLVRLGVDWGRLVPDEPNPHRGSLINQSALHQYVDVSGNDDSSASRGTYMCVSCKYDRYIHFLF